MFWTIFRSIQPIKMSYDLFHTYLIYKLKTCYIAAWASIVDIFFYFFLHCKQFLGEKKLNLWLKMFKETNRGSAAELPPPRWDPDQSVQNTQDQKLLQGIMKEILGPKNTSLKQTQRQYKTRWHEKDRLLSIFQAKRRLNFQAKTGLLLV